MPTSRFELVLTLVVVLASQPCFAQPIDIWWDSLDDKWCLRTDTDLACLPTEYVLGRVSKERLQFADRTEIDQAYFLTFEMHEHSSSSYALFVNDSFVLDSQSNDFGLLVSRFRPDPSKKPVLQMYVATIAIDSYHTIVIHGKSAERVSNIVDLIVSQWSLSK